MFLTRKRPAPESLPRPRLRLVNETAGAMGRVPNDREDKLLNLLEAFADIDVTRHDQPTVWKLQTLQRLARAKAAGYTR